MERKRFFFAKGYVHITNSKQRKHPLPGHRRNNVLEKERFVPREKLGPSGDACQPVLMLPRPVRTISADLRPCAPDSSTPRASLPRRRYGQSPAVSAKNASCHPGVQPLLLFERG